MKVSSIGESGYEPPADQAGIVTPTFSSWLDQSLAASTTTATTRRRRSSPGLGRLQMGSDGIMVNSKGQKLSFTVINIGDYSDWVASMQVVAQNLKAVGIQVTPDNLTNTDFTAALYTGNSSSPTTTSRPSARARTTSCGTGWTRRAPRRSARRRPPTTSGTATRPRTTCSASTRPPPAGAAAPIMNQIQQVMLAELPIIPVVQAVDWYQYDDSSLTGLAHAGATPTPSRPPMPIRTWSRCCSTCGRSDRGACPGAGPRARATRAPRPADDMVDG